MDIGGYPEQVHQGVKWISIGYPLDIHFRHGYPFFLCYGELLIYQNESYCCRQGGVVASTLASHALGPGFDPGLAHVV